MKQLHFHFHVFIYSLCSSVVSSLVMKASTQSLHRRLKIIWEGICCVHICAFTFFCIKTALVIISEQYTDNNVHIYTGKINVFFPSFCRLSFGG